MSNFEDAKALVAHAEREVASLKTSYDVSLHEKAVKPSLLIEIKNLMENLRSALDFAAHGLFEKFGSSTRTDPKIYFPYAFLSQSHSAFQSSNRIETCIPGISASRPDIVAKLESYQAFADPSNRWLPVFMDLNNENKHQRLTPQTRIETKQLTIESGGASISLGHGCSISMGPGCSISMGGITIPGGQNISADRPAIYAGQGRQTVTTWVSFKFDSNGEPVLPFLTRAVQGTRGIIDELEFL